MLVVQCLVLSHHTREGWEIPCSFVEFLAAIPEIWPGLHLEGYETASAITRVQMIQLVRFLLLHVIPDPPYCHLQFHVEWRSGCCLVASPSPQSCCPANCLHHISLSSSLGLSLFWVIILLDPGSRTA
ncbi:hypothetical protein EDD15DRAFT_2522126 [Pisolithus albus]|nr:hypothetical protein EDD15DRAFT_2522126 [Pisolithus albus]